jgi:ribosome-binding protein aMBF1 (putative translation factor)
MFERTHIGLSQAGRLPLAADGSSWPPAAEESLQVVLGRRLRWLRLEHGMSRKALAARLRLTEELIEGYERGTGTIRARQLVAYARLFHLRISSFFRDPPTTGSA